MRFHAIGFGALNLDEFWEVSEGFLASLGLESGREYIRDEDWFREIYPQLTAQGHRRALDPGGSAANMIAALRRMGFSTGFYGVTGSEDLHLLRTEELGERESLRIRATQHPAGRCLSLVHGTGRARDRTLVIFPNANDLANLYVPETDYFLTALWVHMTSFATPVVLDAQAILARGLREPTRLSFDPGAVYCRLGLERLRPVIERTAILFLSVEEMQLLTGQPDPEGAAEALFGLGVGTIVVKLGADGLIGFSEGRKVYQPAVTPASVRDRTGAGDVAAAGFLAGVLSSMSLGECLALAALCASKSLEGYGRATYPDAASLEELKARARCVVRP